MIRCVFVFPWYEWGMGFKKNMKGEAPPVQAPKVETVSAGESEHAAKRIGQSHGTDPSEGRRGPAYPLASGA